MVWTNFAGLTILFLSSSVLIFLVPPERIKKFSLFGIIGGLLIAVALINLMQNYFGFWVFRHVDLFTFINVPFFLSAAWFPTIILFRHLLVESNSFAVQAAFIVIFPLIAVITHYFLLIFGMMVYNNWNIFLTFIVAFFIHLGLAGYLYVAGLLKIKA